MFDPPPDPALRVRLVAPAPLPHPLVPALAAAGVVVDPDAAVGLVVQVGRSVDAAVDPWVVESTPHLLVAAHPHALEVGPWVLPGVGPCAHCVAASTLCRPETSVPPLAAALWALAAGWVARDLSAWLRGDTVATWATSWMLGMDPLPRPRRWERHPYCGCAWFDL